MFQIELRDGLTISKNQGNSLIFIHQNEFEQSLEKFLLLHPYYSSKLPCRNQEFFISTNLSVTAFFIIDE